MTSADEAPRIDLDELAALEEQREFLLTSLEDLDREHAVGDLDDEDYETLRADYTLRAARVIEAIDQHQELIDATDPGHHGLRRLVLVVAVVVVAAVAAIVVTNSSGSRRQTTTDTGVIVPSKATQACIDRMGTTFGASTTDANFASEAVATLKCFTDRIDQDPRDVVAYAYRARTESLVAKQLAGVADRADVENFSRRATADIHKALQLQPDYPDALAFGAMDALGNGDVASAKRYLARIDRLQLPANNPVLPIVNNVIRPAVEGRAPTTTATTTTAPFTTSSG